MKDSSTATERVGRYQLLEPIGGGPNGMVSRAKVFGVAGFERQFAVKRFHADLTAGPAAQSLSQAARSYGSLEHPRIARMSEFGVAQGHTFTAVEYVAGLDVFRLLQEAKLASVAIAAGGALALVSQAARAVGYAHGRGLSHLGLAPTNVIVTADGDVKVTDFGILAATMPARPAESSRLGSRVPYLSPEQIAGEATSAATDVFVLGVIAYELVTGQRAYRGDSPAAIAQAILAGPPAEPALPRPIVRVLQRCLARSPFERFPDARALADALDAALRVAPVPGTRKDVGVQVKTTLERYATLNEGNVSGMVALNFGTQPTSDNISTPLAGRRPEARTEPSPVPVFDAATSGLAASQSGAAATQRDLLKPTATMPGLVPPPPIPVPPGVVLPPGASTPTIPSSTSTIPGMHVAKKPQIPSIVPPRPPGPPPAPSQPLPPLRPPSAPPKATSLTQGWDAMPDPTEPSSAPAAGSPAPPAAPPGPPAGLAKLGGPPKPPPSSRPLPVMPAKVNSLTQGWDAMPDPSDSAMDQDTVFGLSTPPAAPPPHGEKRLTPGSFDSTTGEMSMSQIDALNRRAVMSTENMPPVVSPNDAITKPVSIANAPAPEPADPSDLPIASPGFAGARSGAGGAESLIQDALDNVEPDASSTMPSLAPPPPSPRPGSAPSMSQPGITPPAPIAIAPAAASIESAPVARPPMPPSASKLPLIAGIVLGIGVLGAAGFFAYNELIAKKSDDTVAMGSGSAGSAIGSDGSAAGSAVAMGSDGSAGTSAGSGSDGSAVVMGSDGSAGSSAGPGSNGSAAGSAVATGSDGSAGSATGSAAAAGSGSAIAMTGSSAGSAAGSGSAIAMTGSGAGSAAPDTTTTKATPSQKSDQLEVTSTPPGALVFLDGAELGASPQKIPGTADRHTLAVLMPGHDLYVAEVDGAGVYNITLSPVKQPKAGPGIKVEKCKAKNRYYIYVDGQPSGQTCPTDKRIVTSGLGVHSVEVYDIVTETRKKYEVDIKDDRLSVRVKIDE